MKQYLAAILLLVSATAAAKGAPQFDPSGDPARQAATFLKASKLTALAGVKRIAFSQFRVEFAVENSGKASSSSTGGFTSSKSDIKLVGVSDEVRQAIADQLYDDLVKGLAEAGVEVVPYESLSANERYKSMEPILRRGFAPVGMQAGKSVFVGAHGTPYYFTNDDHHLGLGTALGGFSTIQPQNIEPRIAETLDATVLRATISVKFSEMDTNGGMFHMSSSVKTSEALALVPEQTTFLFVTPNRGKAKVALAKTINMPGDAISLRDTTTKKEKTAQAIGNAIGGLLGGGVHSVRHYEAVAEPDGYRILVSQYGSAMESALMSLLRPALTGAAKN
jgi:hypothetical protein